MPSKERFRCLTCDYDLCRECYATAPREVQTHQHPSTAPADMEELAAMDLVNMDDKKVTTEELEDAPAAPSLLMMALAGEPMSEPPKTISRVRACSEDSTDAASIVSLVSSEDSHGVSCARSSGSTRSSDEAKDHTGANWYPKQRGRGAYRRPNNAHNGQQQSQQQPPQKHGQQWAQYGGWQERPRNAGAAAQQRAKRSNWISKPRHQNIEA